MPARRISFRIAAAWLSPLAILGAARLAAGADGPAPPPPAPAPPIPLAPPEPPVSATPTGPGTVEGPSKAAEAAWLADPGTAMLGLGLLRVAPSHPGTPGRLRLRYEEKPNTYAQFDAIQLVVLPGDAFATEGRCFADRALAYARTAPGTYATDVEVEVPAPALLLVAYGPFQGIDLGRPLGTARAYTLEVVEAHGVSRAWVDPEAGELTVKGWTNRPEVKRGGAVTDPVTKAPHWFEARPEILYDRARWRGPDDGETPDALAKRREADTLHRRAEDLRAAGKPDAATDLDREADDLLATLRASDDRIPLPAALAARFARLPFRWK